MLNERTLCIKLPAYVLRFKPFLAPTHTLKIHHTCSFFISGQFLIRVRHIDQAFAASFNFIYADFLSFSSQLQTTMSA